MSEQQAGTHRLSNVDPVAKTGVCSLCGPVAVRIRAGRRGAECWTKRIEYRASESAKRSKKKWHATRHGVSVASLAQSCEICGATEELVVDHDHTCCPGKQGCASCVRGRLCRSCNLGLGDFADDATKLAAALVYLAKSPARQSVS